MISTLSAFLSCATVAMLLASASASGAGADESRFGLLPTTFAAGLRFGAGRFVLRTTRLGFSPALRVLTLFFAPAFFGAGAAFALSFFFATGFFAELFF